MHIQREALAMSRGEFDLSTGEGAGRDRETAPISHCAQARVHLLVSLTDVPRFALASLPVTSN